MLKCHFGCKTFCGMNQFQLQGQQCANCGTFFRDKHTYPVLCNDCWNDADSDDVLVYKLKKATKEEL